MSTNRPFARLAERRSEKTSAALKQAFTKLVFAKGFENVSVGEIVQAASLARSTFYEHFSNRDDILRACMAQFFDQFAACVGSDTQPADLVRALSHLWENRRLTDAIFSGAPRVVLARALTDMVESQLRSRFGPDRLALPLRLAAIEIAEGQMAMIDSWLRGQAYCSADRLAVGLHQSTRAAALALSGGNAPVDIPLS